MPRREELRDLFNDEEFIKELILIAAKYFRRFDQFGDSGQFKETDHFKESGHFEKFEPFGELVSEAIIYVFEKIGYTVKETDNLRKFAVDEMHDRFRFKLMSNKKYLDILERKAWKILDRKEYAWDMVSDTCRIMLAKTIDDLKNIYTHVQTYVDAVLKFTCYKKNKEEGRYAFTEESIESAVREDTQDLKDLNECLDELHEFLKATSPREAQIFNMLREGYTDKEIAEKLDMSYNTARTAISRLRKQIRGKCRRDSGVE